MAPALTPTVRKLFEDRINERLLYVENSDEVVVELYELLLMTLNQNFKILEEISTFLGQSIMHETLFRKQMVTRESRVFYCITINILQGAGMNSPIPMHVAQLLYVSQNRAGLSSEEKELENDIISKCKCIYEFFEWKSVLLNSALRNNVQNPARFAIASSPTTHAQDEGNEQDDGESAPAFTQEKMDAANPLRNQRSSKLSGSANGSRGSSIAPAAGKRNEDESFSKRKGSFRTTILKMYEKEPNLFTGTDSRSWATHLYTYCELAESHDITEPGVVLAMILWTLGPGPKMVWKRYRNEECSSWDGFVEIMGNTYNSEMA